VSSDRAPGERFDITKRPYSRSSTPDAVELDSNFHHDGRPLISNSLDDRNGIIGRTSKMAKEAWTAGSSTLPETVYFTTIPPLSALSRTRPAISVGGSQYLPQAEGEWMEGEQLGFLAWADLPQARIRRSSKDHG
jgi:hypothetical protein